MQGANFTGCILIHANLNGANLEECSFMRAMLDAAQLEGASLKKANLVDARIDVETTTKTNVFAGPDGKYVMTKSAKEIIFDHTMITEHSLLYADLEYFSTKVDLLRKEDRTYYSDFSEPKGDIFTRASEIRKIIKATPRSERGDEVTSM
jgi:uncharacterized protein YjbI with pentapeptide repeats